MNVAARDPKLVRKAVAAATMGNALEFYDFITFAFFAIQIGKTFFPSESPYLSLMASLGTFWVGFFARPVGAWVLGGYADRHGRKPAMLISMTMMGAGILILCLTPGYHTIGIAAPIIAIFARLVQGFALGGEVGSATTYMMEAVEDHRRGFSISWQGASQNISGTVGALVGVVLTYFLTDDQLTAYGWRIALLLGTSIIPFALVVRRSLPETRHLPETEHADVATTGLRPFARVITLGVVMIGGGTIATYISQYMATYGQNTLKLSETVSLTGEFANNAISVVTILWAGALSDKYGRKPVMVYTTALSMVSIIPAYLWLVTERDAISFIGANLIIAGFGSMPFGPLYAAISESLPKAVRARAFALIYAVPVMVFGGSTQMVVTWILKVTGEPMSIAWYLTGVSGVSLIAMMLMEETAPSRRQPVPIPLSEVPPA